jgi:hypothetical protein
MPFLYVAEASLQNECLMGRISQTFFRRQGGKRVDFVKFTRYLERLRFGYDFGLRPALIHST